jgi:uncharacterized FlgJ-related protein
MSKKVTVAIDESVLDELVNVQLHTAFMNLRDSIEGLEWTRNNGGLKPHREQDLQDDKRYFEALETLREYFGF